MARGKRNRLRQRENRAKRVRESMPLRLHDDVDEKGIFAEFGDNNYKAQEHEHKKTFNDYINRNKLNSTQAGLTLHRPTNRLPVIVISSSLQQDRKEAAKMTGICPSDRGLNLDQRSAVGLGLDPTDSYEVRWDGVDGALIALVLRDVFSPEEAAAVRLFEEEHKKHSKGWSRGCEADLISRENRTRMQLKRNRLVDSSGINHECKLTKIGPGGKGKTTKVKMSYKNPDGKEINLPFNSFLDRMKWTPRGAKDGHKYQQFLDKSDSSATHYFQTLKDRYLQNCLLFMDEKYIHSINEIESEILMNTNVIDDYESVMAIHHDVATPTPALVAGSSNFQYSNGGWQRKNNGGRLFLAEGLFWIDFNPTDIALFDGNVPHGVTYMRPLKCHGDQKLETEIRVDGLSEHERYNRFTIVLFSTFGRTKKKMHGGFFRDR
jgi:hypothetical protein